MVLRHSWERTYATCRREGAVVRGGAFKRFQSKDSAGVETEGDPLVVRLSGDAGGIHIVTEPEPVPIVGAALLRGHLATRLQQGRHE